MKNAAAKYAFRSGCLISVVAPLLAIVLYPRAKWLFAFVLVGIALLIVLVRLQRYEATPQEVADRAERLLMGRAYGYDVDDYEHLHPKDPRVRELWTRSMTVGGLPEEWPQLGADKKAELLEVIRALKHLGSRS